jgi:hypothetical protein
VIRGLSRLIIMWRCAQYVTLRNCGSPSRARNCTNDPAYNNNLVHCHSTLFLSVARGHGCARYTYPANMNLRKAPASSMQKTYDECYLTCSTAIYFEGQVGWTQSVQPESDR